MLWIKIFTYVVSYEATHSNRAMLIDLPIHTHMHTYMWKIHTFFCMNISNKLPIKTILPSTISTTNFLLLCIYTLKNIFIHMLIRINNYCTYKDSRQFFFLYVFVQIKYFFHALITAYNLNIYINYFHITLENPMKFKLTYNTCI